MLLEKASLDARVGWIKQEIEHQLKHITSHLMRYADAKAGHGDVTLLERSRDALAEILKAMEMTGVQGGSRLTAEMHALVENLLVGKVVDEANSLKILQKGVSQINEYMQHLQDGYADLPIVILPLLNELRAARGAGLLSELLVFLPEDGVIGHSHIGTDEMIAIADSKRTLTYQHLRMHFQQALLTWFKNKNTQQSLQKIQTLSYDLLRIHEPMSVRVLWWLSQALAQALRENRLGHGSAVKLVFGSMDRLILTLSQTHKDELDSIAEIDDIKKNLLYYLGMAKKGSPLVDAVKEAFLLDIYLPQGETLEKLRNHYASPGQQLWRSVADGVNEDIKSIMEGFQSMELNLDEGILQLIIDKSRRTATTLSMLGLGRLAEIIDKQVDEFNVLKKNPRDFTDKRRLETATEWLRVKDILDEYAETGEDVTQRLFSAEGKYQVSNYSARKKVLQIVEAKLSYAVNQLEKYIPSNDLSCFEAVRDAMHTVDHTLKFLHHHEEAYPVTVGAIWFVEKYILPGSDSPNAESVLKLIQALKSLGASVVALRNNAEHLTILEAGYQEIHELHKLCHLHEDIEQQIERTIEGNHTLKKLNRQKKMDLILAL